MKVKELINRLNQYDTNKELVLYVLDNGNLFHTEIETILDMEEPGNSDGDRIEITVYLPKELENLEEGP
jgi:hypothetical protein